MSRSQKIIFLTVGVYVVGFVAYLAVNSMWIQPARRLDNLIRERRKDLHEQDIQTRGRSPLRRRLDETVAATLDTDYAQVRERVRERLMELLGQSGLGPTGLSVDLFDGVRRDAFREVGAAVQASGRLEDVVNFLYLLQSEPVLHRVDNLSITPSRRDGAVDLRFRYVTLVFDTTSGDAPKTLPAELPEPQVASAGRELYDSIVQRNLFAPYIRRPEPPVVSRPRPQRPTERPQQSPQPQQPPAEDSFRVVGLPTMGGEALVYLRDPDQEQVSTYNVGDRVGRMTIVAVDYRRMRWRDEYSTSRVVLRSGGDYWAVELGDTIGQRRPLRNRDLPVELRRVPSDAPADDETEADADARARG